MGFHKTVILLYVPRLWDDATRRSGNYFHQSVKVASGKNRFVLGMTVSTLIWLAT